MKAPGAFIAGTDTGVGKTRVAAALLRAWARRGLRVAGMKPVAAGAALHGETWRNEDAEALYAAASVRAPWEWVNPYCFAPSIAPHIAAQQAGVRIEPARISAAFDELRARADRIVVEGAGGLLVPLNEDVDMADVAGLLGLPVVLVVGMRLGCLNHALLTAEAIAARGLKFAGWVANSIDPGMAEVEANLALLEQRIAAPCIGHLAYGASGEALNWAALEGLFRA